MMRDLLKRSMDVTLAVIGLVAASPILLPVMALVWLQDFHSPFYIPARVGRRGKPFRMVKLRSMVVGADKTGVDSTSANDTRITAVGRFIRRWKLDELSQLSNVVVGDMSLVGPRPNVQREVDLYTSIERSLLDVRPGITDMASIVFSDEGEILAGTRDPDLAYNQLIRPWKSRLGLLYVQHRSVSLDFRLVFLTAIAIISRPVALRGVIRILEQIGAPADVIRVAARQEQLTPFPPPGALEVVTSR